MSKFPAGDRQAATGDPLIVTRQSSLSVRQALYTMLVGALLAVFISGLLVYLDLRNVRSQIDGQVHQMMGAVRSSAAQAAYEIDPVRAQSAISGIFKDPSILEVKITDDFGSSLAQSLRFEENDEKTLLVDWLLRGKLEYAEPLVWGNAEKVVGKIAIRINGPHVARDFIARTVRTIVSTFILVFVLTAVFTLVFFLFTIRPILRIVKSLASVDTSNPGRETIPRPLKHAHDELGLLVAAINQLIHGFSDSLAASLAAEARIKKNEARYRLLFENSPLGIVTIDREGQILEVNPKILEILGSPSEDDTRAINMFHFPPIIEAGIAGKFRQSVETGVIGTFETVYTSKWGRRFFMRYHVHPIQDEYGVNQGCQGLIEDITVEKRLEEQLEQTRKLEAAGNLAGGISHDFNNILQAISGYTQLLLMEKKELDDEYSDLVSIKNSAERAARLVRLLLLFSQKAETNLQPTDLNQEIGRTVKVLEREIDPNITITRRPGTRLWLVKADQGQIEHVLKELAENAAEAMPTGGQLVIETKNVVLGEAFSKIELGAEPGPYVLLTVSDTGHGMDFDTRDHLFDPFFTTREIGQGTGMGAASVYGIVKKHGGYIKVDSEPGQGTSIQVYLPAMAPTGVETTGTSLQGGNENILIVDDEEYIRDLAAQILRKYGYAVRTATSGEEALQIYTEHPGVIDLVIMDIGMPGMGGHQCLQEILKIDPSAKITMATGYAVEDQAKSSMAVGAVGYIAKPYHLEELLEKVRSVLDHS